MAQLKVSLENIIPLTEARDHFSQIVAEVQRDKLYVLTKGGKPAVAIIDVKYLEAISGGSINTSHVEKEILKDPLKVGRTPMIAHAKPNPVVSNDSTPQQTNSFSPAPKNPIKISFQPTPADKPNPQPLTMPNTNTNPTQNTHTDTSSFYVPKPAAPNPTPDAPTLNVPPVSTSTPPVTTVPISTTPPTSTPNSQFHNPTPPHFPTSSMSNPTPNSQPPAFSPTPVTPVSNPTPNSGSQFQTSSSQLQTPSSTPTPKPQPTTSTPAPTPGLANTQTIPMNNSGSTIDVIASTEDSFATNKPAASPFNNVRIPENRPGAAQYGGSMANSDPDDMALD